MGRQHRDLSVLFFRGYNTFAAGLLLLLVCSNSVKPAASAPLIEGLFSGDGIEGAEDEAFPCDICLDEILSRLTFQAPAPCNQVARLTECFEQCTPTVPEEEVDSGVRQLIMLTQTSKILTLLRANDCDVYEDLAPGCNTDILNCLEPVIPRSQSYPYSMSPLQCSDDALVNVLQCTGNTPDCEWRSHIEMIASRGRRSVCAADDKCLAGNLLFVTGPECKTYRMVDMNNIVNVLTQTPMPTAPGTLFDTTICGLGHASTVTC